MPRLLFCFTAKNRRSEGLSRWGMLYYAAIKKAAGRLLFSLSKCFVNCFSLLAILFYSKAAACQAWPLL